MDSITGTMLLRRESALRQMVSNNETTSFDHLDKQTFGKSNEQIGHLRMLIGFYFFRQAFSVCQKIPKDIVE